VAGPGLIRFVCSWDEPGLQFESKASTRCCPLVSLVYSRKGLHTVVEAETSLRECLPVWSGWWDIRGISACRVEKVENLSSCMLWLGIWCTCASAAVLTAPSLSLLGPSCPLPKAYIA
jgi:hypothetical protein